MIVALQRHVRVLFSLRLRWSSGADHAFVGSDSVGVGHLEATVVGASELEHIVSHVVWGDDVLRLVATLVYGSGISIFSVLALSKVSRVLHSRLLGRDPAVVIDRLEISSCLSPRERIVLLYFGRRRAISF